MDELGELVNRSLAREYGLRVLYAGDSASDIIPNGGITTPELSIWMPRSFICAYNKIRTGKPSRRLPELAQLWSDIKPHIIGKGLTARSEPYSRMAVDVVVPEFERWEGLPHAWVGYSVHVGTQLLERPEKRLEYVTLRVKADYD